ncbi:MAG: carbonic anhydrase family protein [Thiomicrorhabdus sp.]|nr:carbonic anhydrase family protein [Thiomicrorhabdus sp.]
MKRIALVSALSLALVSNAFANSHEGHEHVVHWGYTGEAGPSHWGDLKTEYGTCKTGKQQSPINITAAKDIEQHAIKFDYHSSTMNIVNNGHTVQNNFAKGSSITLEGKTFNLLQVHFHTPSENHLEGQSYPMEAHFVHKSDDDKLAVVAVLIKEGASNPFLQKIVDNMPHHETAAKDVAGVEMNGADFVPAGNGYYAFMGSLTTPPCSEGVQWLMMKSQAEASKEQIAALHEVMHTNNRPIQATNSREILE